jgi:hypothetical protein
MTALPRACQCRPGWAGVGRAGDPGRCSSRRLGALPTGHLRPSLQGGSKNPDAFCDVQAGFKPGSNGGVDKNWLRVTVKYSIWVNGVKKTDGEIKIDKQYSKKDGDVWNATPKSHTWFTRFKPCDEIEIRWARLPSSEKTRPHWRKSGSASSGPGRTSTRSRGTAL